MTLAEYSEVIHEWCIEVERQGVELFKSGVAPTDCTGLAIQLVESRRKKKSAEQSRLAVPAGARVFPN